MSGRKTKRNNGGLLAILFLCYHGNKMDLYSNGAKRRRTTNIESEKGVPSMKSWLFCLGLHQPVVMTGVKITTHTLSLSSLSLALALSLYFLLNKRSHTPFISLLCCLLFSCSFLKWPALDLYYIVTLVHYSELPSLLGTPHTHII